MEFLPAKKTHFHLNFSNKTTPVAKWNVTVLQAVGLHRSVENEVPTQTSIP
ncbi:MAG: hypothetical protein LBQ66_00300 [Planctomycetaceae bacterium]|nr:hypothetical protein [Planctomycetaceae bacterium]